MSPGDLERKDRTLEYLSSKSGLYCKCGLGSELGSIVFAPILSGFIWNVLYEYVRCTDLTDLQW